MLAAQTDTVVAERFLRVVGMIDSPVSPRPAMMLRLAQAGGPPSRPSATARNAIWPTVRAQRIAGLGWAT